MPRHAPPRHASGRRFSSQTSPAKRLWFEDSGLQFECTRCGACCRNKDVQASYVECMAMAKELGLEGGVEQFLDEFVEAELVQGKQYLLKQIGGGDQKQCIFLSGDKESGFSCRAHASKPMACSTYPFWPQNLISRHEWECTASECEGVGLGSVVASDAIERDIASQLVRDHGFDSGAGSYRYDDSLNILDEVGPERYQPMVDEFFQKNQTFTVYKDDKMRVVDRINPDSGASRHLLFESALNLSQSEMPLGPRGQPDHSRLLVPIHAAMVSLYAAVCGGGEQNRVCVIGSGAGAMPMFLQHAVPGAAVTAVEFDPDVLKIGSEFFGSVGSDTLKFVSAEGAAFLAESEKESFDVVLLDAFSNGLGPPPSLADPTSLAPVLTNRLNSTNAVIANLVGPLKHKQSVIRAALSDSTFDTIALAGIDSQNRSGFGWVLLAARSADAKERMRVSKLLEPDGLYEAVSAMGGAGAPLLRNLGLQHPDTAQGSWRLTWQRLR